MNERVNKMNELQEQHKKRMAEWLASVPHVDELLALQLQGTIPKQMPGDVQTNGYLREIAQKSRRELDKARYILERQAKAGVVTIPYYADEYPRHFCGLGNDAPPLIHVLGNRELLNREDNVTIIGSRAADRDGLAAASRMAEQIGGAGHVVISGLARDAIRPLIAAALMRADRRLPSWRRVWISFIPNRIRPCRTKFWQMEGSFCRSTPSA